MTTLNDSGNPYKKNLVIASIGGVVATTANSMWIMFIPFFFSSLGIIDILIGVIFSLGALSSGLLSFLGGRLADKLGRRFTIGIGYAIYSTGPLIIFFSIMATEGLSIITSIFGFIWMFMGSGIAGPGMSMLLMESSSEKRKGLSYMIVARVLPSIPPAIVIFIGAEFYNRGLYSVSLLIGFVCILLTAFLFQFGFKETLCSEEKSGSQIPKKKVRFRDTFLTLIIIAFAFDSLSSKGLSWYVPIFLGTSEEAVLLYGTMTSMATIVIALSALGSGWVVDKIGSAGAILVGWLPLSLAVALFPHFVDPLFLILLYSVWSGLDMMDISIPAIVVSEHYPPQNRGSAMGTFQSSVQISSIVGPTVISGILIFGSVLPFYLKSVLNLLGAFVFLYASRRYLPDSEIDSDASKIEHG